MDIDPFYTFSRTHCRVISDTFIFYFSHIFPLLNTVIEATIGTISLTVQHLFYLQDTMLRQWTPDASEPFPREIDNYPKYIKDVPLHTCLVYLPLREY